jgi:hypothetical protein
MEVLNLNFYYPELFLIISTICLLTVKYKKRQDFTDDIILLFSHYTIYNYVFYILLNSTTTANQVAQENSLKFISALFFGTFILYF